MKKNVVTVYGNMKWFRVAEQPPESDFLPFEMARARAQWEAEPQGNLEEVIKLVSPFVGGRFVADNLAGWRDLLTEDTFGEFEASRLRVVGVDFSNTPIPLCKVEGWFDLPLKDGVSQSDVDRWIDENHNGELFSALSFYWDFDNPKLDDLDLTVADHMGAEAVVINDA